MTRNLRSLLAVACLAFTGAVAGGCVGGPASLAGAAPLTPLSRYSLQVEPGLDRIALAVHDVGLSPRQQAALNDLAMRFARSGAPELVVEAPSGDDPVSASMAWAIRSALEGAGVPGERLRLAGYHAPAPRAPVLAGFETLQAVVPRCGQQWGNLGRTGDNRSASNLGCAINANLAAQVSQPRDLVQPRDMTPADAGRRAVVMDNYVLGQPTSAQPEQRLAGMRISQAVE